MADTGRVVACGRARCLGGDLTPPFGAGLRARSVSRAGRATGRDRRESPRAPCRRAVAARARSFRAVRCRVGAVGAADRRDGPRREQRGEPQTILPMLVRRVTDTTRADDHAIRERRRRRPRTRRAVISDALDRLRVARVCRSAGFVARAGDRGRRGSGRARVVPAPPRVQCLRADRSRRLRPPPEDDSRVPMHACGLEPSEPPARSTSVSFGGGRMRHQRKQFVRFSKPRLVALGAVAVLTLAACGGSTTGTTRTPGGQSPTPTTASSGGGGYY